MKIYLILIIVTTGLLFQCTKPAHPVEEKAATEVALQWLTLVDSAHYEQSWDEAAEFFQNAISKSGWQTQLDKARNPLGELISRDVKSTQYATSLPGAPDGEYVVVTFQSSFENKKSAIETVTPMKDKSGKWRVAGYYIR